MQLTPTNLSYAAFLSLDDGKSTASGFHVIHNMFTYLITAKHVLFDDDEKLRCKTILATTRNVTGPEGEVRQVTIQAEVVDIIKHPAQDVVALRIEDNDLFDVQQDGLEIEPINSDDFKAFDQIQIATDVFLIGFPSSLFSQGDDYFDVDRPLLRKGIIAGINQKAGTFIIDCPAYYGNSGGPIIEVSKDGKYALSGLVSRYIPFITEWRNNRELSISQTELANSGYSICVPASAILTILNKATT